MISLLAWLGTDCQDTSCEIGNTIGVLLWFAMPFVITGLLLIALVIAIKRYKQAKSSGNITATRTYRKFFIIFGLIITAAIATPFVGSLFVERARTERIKNTDFVIWAPPDQQINTEYLSRTGESTVPHVQAKLQSPKGAIQIRQAKLDSEVSKLFQPPDRCDIHELNSYLGALGRAIKQPTNITCRTVASTGGWTVLTPIMPDRLDGSAPFAASKDGTILVFNAYRSSAGDFKGSPAEAEPYIIDFLTSSQPVAIESLL